MKTFLIALIFALSVPAFADTLGVVTPSTRRCPKGGIAGATCYALPVSACSGVADYTAYAKVLQPSGTAKATVLFLNGGTGAGIWEQMVSSDRVPVGTNTVKAIVAGGSTVVEVSFGPPFVPRAGQAWETGPGGIRAVACRPASLAHWAYIQVHLSNASKPFIVVGTSAGAQAFGECLSHYGCGGFVQMAELVSGPPFTDVAKGCILGLSSPIPTACGGGNAAYLVGLSNAQSILDIAYPGPWCSTAQTNGERIHKGTFDGDSINTPDALYSYPSTYVHFLWGSADLTSAQPQGLLFESLITTSTNYSCVSGANHQVGANVAGGAQIVLDVSNFIATWLPPYPSA